MVFGWKSHTTLRVLPISSQQEGLELEEQKLFVFLRQLRILAQIQTVTWDHPQRYLPDGQGEAANGASAVAAATAVESEDGAVDGDRIQDYREVPENYVKALNELIVSNSRRTAVSFMYLPTPLPDTALFSKYLAQLEALTNSFGPTVYVHGFHPVTSTTI